MQRGNPQAKDRILAVWPWPEALGELTDVKEVCSVLSER